MADDSGFERTRRFRRGSGSLRREIDEELSFHIEMTVAELKAEGLSREEALREARRRFGDLERHRRRCREVAERNRRAQSRGEIMADLLMDLKLAWRNMRANPGFAAVALFTLALGITANATIFGMIHGIVYAPLPYEDYQRIVFVWTSYPDRDAPRNSSSAPDFHDYRTRAESLSALSAHTDMNANLTGGDEPLAVRGYETSVNVFDMLGVQPARGRGFIPADEEPGADPVVVLSQRLWSRLGADPDLVGGTLRINDVDHTVIGVMPEGFEYPQLQFRGDLWVPLRLTPEQLGEDRGRRYLTMVGRLAEGVSVEQAQTELDAISEDLEKLFPDTNTGARTWVVPIREEMSAPMRPALAVLLVTVGVVLLICCANVANLMLARTSARRSDIAVRAALGASRMRVIRQLLTESVVIALVAGVLGIVGSEVAGSLIVASLPDFVQETTPSALEAERDVGVMLLTLAVSGLAGIVFGIAPALRASGARLLDSLRSGTPGAVGGAPRSRLTGLLVVGEVALSVILVAAAGLMVKGFAGLVATDLGFESANLLTVNVSLPEARYGEGEEIRQFYRDAVERIGALPGVESAGATHRLPLTFSNSTSSFVIEGEPEPEPGAFPSAGYRSVTPGYLESMRARLLAGRLIRETDRRNTTEVAVVNRSLAERYFPDGDVIGRRIRFRGSDPDEWMEIVGIVGDFRHSSLLEPPRPEMFFPFEQGAYREMTFTVRTAGDPMAAARPVRQAIWSVDPDQPLGDVRTMAEIVDVNLLLFRLPMNLMAVFAVAALVLAAVGLYGVLAYLVVQRRHELGVRMALGASRGSVVRLVLRRALLLGGVGIVLGGVVAVLLGQVMASVLQGVSGTEPGIYLGVPVLLLLITLLASLAPVRRAVRVDPVTSLRAE